MCRFVLDSPIILKLCNVSNYLCSTPDLREDKQFFADHPGAVPISTQQVYCLVYVWFDSLLLSIQIRTEIHYASSWQKVGFLSEKLNLPFPLKGEDLKKLIGASAYIECSAKTQQVIDYLQILLRYIIFQYVLP